MEVLKNKKILALVGIICLLIGTFLPYITISVWGFSESVSLWGYWEGKVVLVLTLANALFIFKDWIEKYIPQLFNNKVGEMVESASNPKFSLVPTILVAAFAVYMLFRIDVSSEYMSYGIGFWILWVGIIALIGHAIFYKKVEVVGDAVNFGAAQPMSQPQSMVQPQPISQPQLMAQPQPMAQTQPMSQPQPMAQPQPMSQPQPMNLENKYCPKCGTRVAGNVMVCPNCGNNFNM